MTHPRQVLIPAIHSEGTAHTMNTLLWGDNAYIWIGGSDPVHSFKGLRTSENWESQLTVWVTFLIVVTNAWPKEVKVYCSSQSKGDIVTGKPWQQ